MKKRITALLLVLVLGLFLALPAAASQGVNTYGLVDDGADLLTEEQEAKLTVYLKSLGERLDISLVVVTVDSLGSKSPKSYADTYYDTYGFLPDGALFLARTRFPLTKSKMRQYPTSPPGTITAPSRPLPSPAKSR